jgi:hypothetical protein
LLEHLNDAGEGKVPDTLADVADHVANEDSDPRFEWKLPTRIDQFCGTPIAWRQKVCMI